MSGHGWVTPNADGSKAKCGGPGVCAECSTERLRAMGGPSVGDLLSTGDGGGEARALLRKALRLLPTSDTRDEIAVFLGDASK